MHPPQVKEQALALVAAGVNDCEIARRTGIARTTIRDWRQPSYVSRRGFEVETCPRCWRAAKPMRFSDDDYAELLGMYLGDGCISQSPRTFRLRITLDLRYPVLIRDTQRLLTRCFPANGVDVVTAGRKGECADVSLYSTHLPCLFPQHAPGPKHLRVIALEPWQDQIVARSPWTFIRGCIRTDGCCFVNRTGPYEYVSYAFTNMSTDIVRLFVGACDAVGVTTRATNGDARGIWHVRINQRSSVALMLDHVGRKT
jgi:hypothetical protein